MSAERHDAAYALHAFIQFELACQKVEIRRQRLRAARSERTRERIAAELKTFEAEQDKYRTAVSEALDAYLNLTKRGGES